MGKSTKSISLVIVADHLALRAGLQLLLEKGSTIKVVGMASNLSDAVSTIAAEKPDVIMLDSDLGEEDGFSVLPSLLGTSGNARIIVLTSRKDPETHRLAVNLGAMGVVQKAADADILMKAIEKVHQGEVWIDRAVMGSVLIDFRTGRDVNPEAIKISKLTTREKEIIRLVGLGLKNKAIAEQLFISEITVAHHLSSIFSKLEVSNRLDLLIYALGHKLAKMP
jgi:two-component system, NarL family, nitrate/nitrite response regulator NarL